MANIHVERKKSVWPWVVGLVVLALLIWGAFELMGNNRAAAPMVTTPATTPVDPTLTGPAATDPARVGDTVGDSPRAVDETPPPR